MTGIGVDDDIYERIQEALNKLPYDDRMILIYDADFNVEERDAIMIKMGMNNQPKRWRYLQKLKDKVKNMIKDD